MKRRRSFFSIFAVAILILSFSSCAVLGGGKKALKSPGTVLRSVDEHQLLQGTFPYLPKESVFEALTVVRSDIADITLFLPTGQTFCHAKWDGKTYTYESAFIENGEAFGICLINDFIDLYSGDYAEKDGGEESDVMEISGRGYSFRIETLEVR